MKQFYEEYETLNNCLLPAQNQSFVIVPSVTAQTDSIGIVPLITAQTDIDNKEQQVEKFVETIFIK